MLCARREAARSKAAQGQSGSHGDREGPWLEEVLPAAEDWMRQVMGRWPVLAGAPLLGCMGWERKGWPELMKSLLHRHHHQSMVSHHQEEGAYLHPACTHTDDTMNGPVTSEIGKLVTITTANRSP